MNALNKIVILGTGNVGWHLAQVLYKAGGNISQVYGRNLQKAESLAAQVLATPIQDLDHIIPNADLYLLCISDNHIKDVAAKLPVVRGIVAHTSGAVNMNELAQNQNYGVFYPLQTLIAGTPVDFSEIPMLCEGNTPQNENALLGLGKTISKKVYAVNSAQREQVHVAAVFANNFSNHMLAQAYAICQKHRIPFEVLHKLVEVTFTKALNGDPKENQTGPAMRHDDKTIAKHLALLPDENLRTLYQIITKSIQQTS